MKKVCFILIVLFTVSILFGCTADDKQEISLYFADKQTKILKSESFSVPSDETAAQFAIEQLLKGPKSTSLVRIIPEGTTLIGLNVSNMVATVNFSQEFEKTTSVTDAVLARYSVVCTLCSIKDIQRVQILVNGRKMVSTVDGAEIGELSRADVILDDDIGRNQTAVINLYFGSKTASGLVAEKRVVEIKDNETIEKTIMTELFKGPEDRGCVRIVPADTKLLHIETKDQVCYVNLSKEFVDKQVNDPLLSKLTVYSIVNSLTDLRQVSSVQFLIEGEKVETIGDMAFTEAFFFDDALILKTLEK